MTEVVWGFTSCSDEDLKGFPPRPYPPVRLVSAGAQKQPAAKETFQVWGVLDFKTDEIRDAEAFGEKVEAYLGQVRRYQSAVRALVGAPPRARLCFLDDRGGIGFYQL
jgi:hypothetical protein